MTLSSTAVSKKASINPAMKHCQTTLVVIDPGVDSYQMLLDGVVDGAELFVLDSNRDGVQQITEIFQTLNSQIQNGISLHIISHGSPGTLYLGNRELSLSTLALYAEDLTSWFNPKSKIQNLKSELFLYGCNVAVGDAGAEFVQFLASLTGAYVSAPTIPIGNGQWPIAATQIFNASTLNTYTATLGISFQTSFQDGVNGVSGLDANFVAPTTVSPDGTQVFVLDDNQLAVFNRDPSGTLTFNTVFTNGTGGVSGLGGSGGIAGVSVSPDGQQVFAASFNNSSIAVFNRDPSGNLTFKESFTTSIRNPTSVVVSPDNQHVFVANYNGNPQLVVLDRDPSSGNLTVNTSFPNITGISQPTFVVASPDGKQLFLAGRSGGIGVFDRDVSGNVTFKEFLSNGSLTNTESVAVSPDGTQVFAKDSDSLVVFDRDAAFGTVTFRASFQDGQDGVEGLSGSFDSVMVSPDGSYVFVAGKSDNSLAVFNRDTSGNLTFNTVFTDGQSGIESLGGASGLSLSPDGTQLFVTSINDNTLSVFNISPPEVNLSLSANSGTEAASTVITVTATADQAVSNNQTVDLTVTGVDITAGDYTLSSSSITIPAGQTTGTVTFMIADDPVDESDIETATLTLSNPSSGLALGATTAQTITIADNDTSDLTLPSSTPNVPLLNDSNRSTPSADTLTGDTTPNRFRGLGGDDELRGGDNDDFLSGNDGDDELFGEADNDELRGRRDNDRLEGGDGDDMMYGDRGNDRIICDAGDDFAKGGAGKDTIFGNDGDDELLGNGGRDKIAGGDGDDTIVGGFGNDKLTGGDGIDTFIYNRPKDGRDLIRDFEVGIDLIDVSNLLEAFEINSGSAFGNEVQLIQRGSRAILTVDVDGLDGRRKAIELAVLKGIDATDVGADSFIL
ncbi:MAG: DUF4347 domain-containing protein [Cyanobacteria bacterium P01_E01_bin.6]